MKKLLLIGATALTAMAFSTATASASYPTHCPHDDCEPTHWTGVSVGNPDNVDAYSAPVIVMSNGVGCEREQYFTIDADGAITITYDQSHSYSPSICSSLEVPINLPWAGQTCAYVADGNGPIVPEYWQQTEETLGGLGSSGDFYSEFVATPGGNTAQQLVVNEHYGTTQWTFFGAYNLQPENSDSLDISDNAEAPCGWFES